MIGVPDETTRNAASRRRAIYEWAKGDPVLLSALLVKAEEALESTRRVLLDVEGSLLAYWTDIPQAEIQRLLPVIRETLGDYEPAKEALDTERYEAHAALAQVLGWGDFRACSTAQQEQFAEWAQEVGLPHLGNPHIRPELFRA